MAEYDKIAKYYDVIFADFFPYEAETRALHRIFQENRVRSVLDASCGTGSHLIRLAGLGYECTGSDISAGMLEAAGKKAGKVEQEIDFFLCDIRELTMERKFDAVISLYGLPLMLAADHREFPPFQNALRHALENIHSKLNEDGIFIFNIINAGSPVPFPGFGPWAESNIQGIEKGDIKIVLMNSIRRSGEFMDFKDIYLIQDKEKTVLEILDYSIWLIPVKRLKDILEESGFRVKSIYSSLSNLDPFDEKSLDLTIVSAASPGT